MARALLCLLAGSITCAAAASSGALRGGRYLAGNNTIPDIPVGALLIKGPSITVPAQGNVTVTFSPVFPAVTPPDVPTGLFLTLMSHDVAKNVTSICAFSSEGRASFRCLADLPMPWPHYTFFVNAPGASTSNTTVKRTDGSGGHNTVEISPDKDGKVAVPLKVNEKTEGVSALFVNLFYDKDIAIRHLAADGTPFDGSARDLVLKGSAGP